MEEDNLLNVYASKFINDSGLREVGAYNNKSHGDWNRKLVDIDSNNHLVFEWYYRGEPIAKTVDDEWVADNPNVRALIISKAKEMMKELLNEDIMEEKKTKKMTKAEAFELLKGKKMGVSCREINKKVQSKLFACGVEWYNGGTDICYYGDYLFIDMFGRLTYCGSKELYYFERHEYEEISVDDILSIEIVEEKKEEAENIHNDLEKWIEIVRNKYCRHGWSFVISESNYALIKGDLIEEKSKR